MDENHQDKTESKLPATEDKLHPLSSKDQGGPDRPQNNRVRTIKLRLGFFGYDKETKEYTPDTQLAKITKEYQPGKTFWDWLQLLIIPLVLAVGGYVFGNWQHYTDQQSALDQQRAAILQTYFDNIQDLMLNHNLLKSNPDDPSNPYYDVETLARTRTLTALQGLDPERKGRLLIFLHEADLIGFDDYYGHPQPRIIVLTDANLTDANLQGANLNNVNLSNANLSGANLTDANLAGADLSYATLNDAHFNGANNLSNANLKGADLNGADLNGSKFLTQDQLDKVSSCKGAILPNGLNGLICN